jgi:hypothetical protein
MGVNAEAAAGGARMAPARGHPRMGLVATLVPIWAVLAALLAAAVAVKVRTDVPWHHVMGDPATTTGWPFWVGFISNAGAIVWAATSAIFFVARRLERDAVRHRFLLASGLFVAMLGVDDLFLLHEQAFPGLLGVPQTAVLAAYAVLAIAYAWTFRAQILATPYPLFLLAAVLLGTSVALDQLMDRFEIYLPASGFLEDACKLLGIGAWLAYAWRTAAQGGAGRG